MPNPPNGTDSTSSTNSSGDPVTDLTNAFEDATKTASQLQQVSITEGEKLKSASTSISSPT